MYSLFCNQDKQVMATGQNSTTLEEVRESLLAYAQDGDLEAGEEASLEVLLELMDFSLVEHEQLIEEYNQIQLSEFVVEL
jgi:DnaJ-domain-containing protein 1